MAKVFDIVFAVCHPDDEALWVGGLLAELSRFDFLRVHVVCLSGRDPTSPRMAEFEAARCIAGYDSGIILGKPLRDANQPLPPLAPTLEEGLKTLGMARPDLVVTHSPFGDEHTNPHHRQAFAELAAWARRTGTPFGFFSCIAIPHFTHKPLLQQLHRKGALHLINMFRCGSNLSIIARLDPGMRHYRAAPRVMLQFLVDGARKADMLSAYVSIGLAAHERLYASFTAYCESLYLCDDKACALFDTVIAAMPAPAAHPLFILEPFMYRVVAKLNRLLGRSN